MAMHVNAIELAPENNHVIDTEKAIFRERKLLQQQGDLYECATLEDARYFFGLPEHHHC